MMPYSTEDSVALVAADTSGLGFAVAERLAHAGARVVVNCAPNDEVANTVVRELRRKYLRRSEDVSDGTQMTRVFGS
jgi:NAD(P)-dependent dehydrogenase (short-subunit alcohol dehydrogenase family)